MASAIKSYVDFYNTIYPYRKNIFIVKFDELIVNHDIIIKNINLRFNTNFRITNLNHKEAMVFVNNNAKEKAIMRLPFPNAEKEERNIINRKKVVSHKLFPKAIVAYQRLFD